MKFSKPWVRRDDVKSLNIILESQKFNGEVDQMLIIAARSGCMDVVERLLSGDERCLV